MMVIQLFVSRMSTATPKQIQKQMIIPTILDFDIYIYISRFFLIFLGECYLVLIWTHNNWLYHQNFQFKSIKQNIGDVNQLRLDNEWGHKGIQPYTTNKVIYRFVWKWGM